MSVVANYIGTLDYPEFYAFANTTKQDVYTVASTNRGLTLGGFSFANDTGSAVQCKLYHYDGTTERLVWTGSVAANSTSIIESNPVRLRASDVIRAVGDASVTLKLSLIAQLETARN